LHFSKEPTTSGCLDAFPPAAHSFSASAFQLSASLSIGHLLLLRIKALAGGWQEVGSGLEGVWKGFLGGIKKH